MPFCVNELLQQTADELDPLFFLMKYSKLLPKVGTAGQTGYLTGVYSGSNKQLVGI